MTLKVSAPVNVRVLHYDGARLRTLLNGQGETTLCLFVGSFYPDVRDGVFRNGGVSPIDVGVGTPYCVTVRGTKTIINERDGTLSVPLNLDGQIQVAIERADGGE